MVGKSKTAGKLARRRYEREKPAGAEERKVDGESAGCQQHRVAADISIVRQGGAQSQGGHCSIEDSRAVALCKTHHKTSLRKCSVRGADRPGRGRRATKNNKKRIGDKKSQNFSLHWPFKLLHANCQVGLR